MARTILKKTGICLVLSVVSSMAVLTAPPMITPAHAEPVSGTGKGIAGGALLGGELVVTVEALFGVKSPWPYVIGGVLGAGAGGVGGYFIEQSAEPRVSLYMLAAGMAFLIPATIVTLNATSYHPPENYQEDQAPKGTEPDADVPQPTGPAKPSTTPGVTTPTSKRKVDQGPSWLVRRSQYKDIRRFALSQPRRVALSLPMASMEKMPTSLVHMYEGRWNMGVPMVELHNVYSVKMQQQMGMRPQTEVRVPVIKAVF
jgi:hypothetical protein